MALAESDESERLETLHSLGLLDTAKSEDFDQITRLTAFCLKTPIALISLVDRDRQQFLSEVGLGLRETTRESAICAHAIEHEGIFEVANLAEDARFRDNPLVSHTPFLRFYAGTPLRTGSGHAIGALCVLGPVPRTLTLEERHQLEALGRLVMDRISLRQSLGRKDAVSGLPNRHQLMSDLESLSAIAHGENKVFVLLEVMGLSQAHEIAQAAGVGVIDSLIHNAAHRTLSLLPKGVTLYHVGVTRFGFSLEPDGALEIVQQLIRAVREPIMAEGVLMQLRARAGLVAYALGVLPAGDLLRQAMTAMNVALKKDMVWAQYDAHEDAKLQRRYRLVQDIENAIANEEFHLVFQPRIDVVSKKTCSVEALIRWRHPSLGSISPAEFIPIVEKTALMQSLTFWVIKTSLNYLSEWRKQRLDITVSINLSARDFDNGTLVAQIERECAAHAIDASCLEFEVTEGEWLRGAEWICDQLRHIRQLGASVAIDDFGTGYSNFAYMNQIPATTLKIDQSLITTIEQNERHRIMVAAILKLARQLGYRTVAEGVETHKTYCLISNWGCDELQGYLFSRPLDPALIPGFVSGFQLPDCDV